MGENISKSRSLDPALAERDSRDLKLLNQNTESLNIEALDVLDFQILTSIKLSKIPCAAARCNDAESLR